MTFRRELAAFVVCVVGLSGCGKAAQAPAPQSPRAAQTPVPQPTTPSSAPAPSAAQGPSAPSFTDISGINAEQTIKDMGALGIFDSTAGEFKPREPITRAVFVRWLVKANNAYYKDPAQQIRLAESDDATFVDVPATHPDFKYIQGMANAGYVVGVDKTHFAPDRPITREEMIYLHIARDVGGNVGSPLDPSELPFADKMAVSPIYARAIDKATSVFSTQDISRIWGSIKTLNPKKPVTRAEAAYCLWEFGWTGVTPFANAGVASGRTKP